MANDAHAYSALPENTVDVSRSTGAAAPSHVPGEPGLWVLIFGDLLLFGAIFTTLLVYRGRTPELFAESQHTLNVDLGVVNTLFLLTSSLLVALGIRGVRRRSGRTASLMFVGAFLCGVGFGFDKYLEYSEKIAHGITPVTNIFYMFYYVLTGLHMLHVLLGLVVLLFLVVQARQPLVNVRTFAYMEGGACFWHLVDLLWIVLFPLLYLVRT